MSQENVEIIRRGFEAFNRGDVDAAMAILAPDCEYVASGAIPGAADIYRGPDGYRRFAGWMLEQFDDARLEVNEIIDAGDQVVISLTNRGRGKRSGAEVTWGIWQVWTLADGMAIRGEGFTSRDVAFEAAGLPE
jgi:ketosteroid isomerase-like protein